MLIKNYTKELFCNLLLHKIIVNDKEYQNGS